MGWPKDDSKWARHKLRQGWRRDCHETGWVKMNCKLWFVVIQRLPIYTSVEARDGIEWDSPAFDCTIDSEYFLEKFEEESLKEEGSHDVKFKSVPDPLSSFQTGCAQIPHYFNLYLQILTVLIVSISFPFLFSILHSTRACLSYQIPLGTSFSITVWILLLFTGAASTDQLCFVVIHSACYCRVVLPDAELDLPYDILLFKIDVKAGAYGLYNFYKMQVSMFSFIMQTFFLVILYSIF